MGKEERTVIEIYRKSTKISFKDIVAFLKALSNNNKIEFSDPKIEEAFKNANEECKKLYKELKDKKTLEKKEGRNNVPKLNGKVQIKIKKEKEEEVKGKSCEEKSEEKIIE